MAIAFSASSASGASTVTSGAALSPLCPATVAPNDILLTCVCYKDLTTVPSTPSGWTELAGPFDIGTTAVGRVWVFGKIAVGTEDGTSVDFGTQGGTTHRWAHRISKFTGYVSGTISQIIPAASFNSVPRATDPAGPTVTTTDAGSLAVAFAGQNDDNAQEIFAGSTGGTWTLHNSYLPVEGTGAASCLQSCVPTSNPGTVSGGAMTVTNDPSFTVGFEIRPTAAATGSSIDLTPAESALVAVALDPVPQPVTVTLTPSALPLAAVALDPVPGQVSVDLTPAALPLEAVALDPTPPPSSVELTPAALDLAAATLDPIPQPVTVTLTPAVLPLAAVTLDVVPGQVTVTLTPAALPLEALPLDPVPQPVIVTLTPAVLSLEAVALDPQAAAGGTIDLTPAAFGLEAVALDPVPQPVTVTLVPADLGLVAVPIDPVPQSVTVTLIPAALGLQAVALDPQGIASGTVMLVPAELGLSAVALDPVPQPVMVALTPAELILSAVALTVAANVPDLNPLRVTFTEAGGPAFREPTLEHTDPAHHIIYLEVV